jgi:myb proto-oncogene protein
MKSANQYTRSKFTSNEDQLLLQLVGKFGNQNWQEIAKSFPDRTIRQLRERYNLYFDTRLNFTSWTEEDEQILIDSHKKYGNSWKKISQQLLPNRSDNEIRNRFKKIQTEKFSRKEPTLNFFDFRFNGLDDDLFSFFENTKSDFDQFLF